MLFTVKCLCRFTKDSHFAIDRDVSTAQCWSSLGDGINKLPITLSEFCNAPIVSNHGATNSPAHQIDHGKVQRILALFYSCKDVKARDIEYGWFLVFTIIFCVDSNTWIRLLSSFKLLESNITYFTNPPAVY